jgi:hypothetical protein
LRMQVKWCPTFIQQGFLLGDAKISTGWVHTEYILPFVPLNKRPSFLVERARFEGIVAAFDDMFEKLWAISRDPATAMLPASPVGGPPEVAATSRPGFMSLRTAAYLAYRRLSGSELIRDLEALRKTPTDRMHEMMRLIVERGLAYGEQWLDGDWVPVNGEDRRYFRVLNDAGDISFGETEEPLFRNAGVRPEDVERFIALFGPI